jgi:2-succinyl-6-hydroxy-2,4-cyclohexadiene-1-carboxylate synthase
LTVALAHGFTQTARSWHRIEELLTDRVDTETVAVDLPGHGAASEVHTDLWGAADHLVDAAGTATYVGYSMGGRVALHAALAHPTKVRRLVLIGATAGIDDPAERAARRAADEQLARRIETEPLGDFIDSWLTNPLFAGLPAEAAQRDDRLRNTPAGLASSLRLCGTGTQESLWQRLGEITVPTLVLAGEHDAKFRALGERLADGIADSRLCVIGGSGHSVHLEQPEATVDAIVEFTGRT